ncbi:MAG: hypothetical protein H6818_14210 [Phycisphaerales bacterium]|nr:hypothetical protein [Phycisphaerales bacterium]MCB9862042.1 hypothetical protein [Phycisphaerales bacterium]
MIRFAVISAISLVASAPGLGCREHAPQSDDSPIESSESTRDAAIIDEQKSTARGSDALLRQTLLRLAAEYREFGIFYTDPSWSPVDCRRPDATPAYSSSDESDTHGQKLYFLYARDSMAYWLLKKDWPQPVSQTIVKETWMPVEVDPVNPLVALDTHMHVASDIGIPDEAGPRPPAMRDGKAYQPGDKGPLFIMHYLGKDAPQTDDGWIYATLTPDGGEITAIGLLDPCMKCHQDAPHGRLFGPPTNAAIPPFDVESTPTDEP